MFRPRASPNFGLPSNISRLGLTERISMKKENEKWVMSNQFEGMTSLRAVLASKKAGISDRCIDTVWYDEAHVRSKAREFAYLRAMSKEYHFSLQTLPRKKLDEMAVSATHGGVIAQCRDRSVPMLSADNLPANGFAVMIEGIEDPYNFGNALRTLYAAGAGCAILTPRNWLSAAGTVCRASAGASELMELRICESAKISDLVHRAGYRICCADSDLPQATSAWDTDLTLPLLLIIGGEKRGISGSLLNQADLIVRLDYGRNFCAALTASAAASLLSYEVLRQNRAKLIEKKPNC